MRTRAGRRLGALACAGALLAACGTAGTDVVVADQPAARATASPPSTSPPTAEPAQARALEIYATVIRELVTVDHTFGSGPSPFEHVWVVDGPVPGIGTPTGTRQPGERFSAAFKAALSRELADLPPLDFIADADEARDMNRDPQVDENGVIVTVGPIEEHGTEIHVGHEIWCGGLCAEWFTYVLKRRDGAWVIVGDTGVRAIS